jgi:uncharacterized repeat protein (TIGR03803 family)
MTSAGGTTYGGTVFKIDTNGTHYSVLYNFNNTDDINGINPYGALLFDGTYLYGMTASGGEDNFGVIFKMDTLVTTSINEIAAASGGINVYPNPVSDNVIIENTTLAKDQTISVYNVQGQLLLQQPMLSSKTTINVSALANGVYFVKVNTKNGVMVKKFVKE